MFQMTKSPWIWSAAETRDRIAAGDISAEELVKASLARIAEQNSALNAFLTICPERALAEARASDARRSEGDPQRVLEGVPFAVKDLTDTAGVRTTSGSTIFADHVPDADELCVARLRAAGAILLGKTNTPEFGFGPRSVNRLCGPTANPYDLTLSAGGSSGGSAAAVAAGLVPIAHGTDFGGSVRTPASFCGVVGLRPTPGLVPSTARPFAWNALSTHGVIARDIDDAALMLSVIAGHDQRDPLSRPNPTPDFFSFKSDLAQMRIGASVDLGVAPISKAVRSAFEEALATVATCFPAIALEAPDCSGAREAFASLRGAIVHRQYGPLVSRRRADLTAQLIWNVEQGRHLMADEMLAAEETRSRVYANFMKFFERYDLLLTPSASVMPFPNTQEEVLEIDGQALGSAIDYLAITYVISLVGLPCLSIPCAWTEPRGPFGVQIIAPPWREDLLLAAARRMERDLNFRHRWPEPQVVTAAIQPPSRSQ
jgi:amidase